MAVSHNGEQSVAEFTLSLDRELRRRFNVGVESYKALKNLGLGILFVYAGLQLGASFFEIVVAVVAVAAPDALELFLGNGLKVSLQDSNDEDE